jgi:DNA-binding response OmpR family regulator
MPKIPRKILLVDDEPDMIKVLKAGLRESGFDVVTAGDGKVGLEKAQTEHPDLIILDLLMPVMDGTELGQILKDDPRTNNIPVIFLTALGITETRAGYKVAGPNVIFAKPFDIKELVDKIEEIFRIISSQ